MSREDIIRMAEQVTSQSPREDWNTNAWVLGEEMLEHFAALVAAHEREACAKLCEMIADNAVLPTANECARAIRRRRDA